MTPDERIPLLAEAVKRRIIETRVWVAGVLKRNTHATAQVR